MKQNRIIGIVFTVINCILIAVCVVFYFRTDRTAPRFDVQAADVVYTAGMEESKILTGITANDNVDGDVTDRIVIEKIIEDNDEQNVVIFFAVSDHAGNVAKFSKVFPLKVEVVETVSVFGTAGFVVDAEPEPMPEPTPTPEDLTLPTPEPTPTPTPTPKPTPTPEAAPTPAPAQEASEPPAPKVNASAPILTLKVTEVKTPVGTQPAWVDVIQTLKDDNDNYETLFHNISVSKYDINKAGTYPVTLTTEDSDGNKSLPAQITIIVQ